MCDSIESGIFLPEDKQTMLNYGLVICTVTGMGYADLQQKGMPFIVTNDLENELLKDRRQNRAHVNETAFLPELFLPDSNNKPLAEQDSLVEEYLEDLKLKLGLRKVTGGISRFTDYGEIILQYLRKGIRLLERDKYPYLCARTRTRVFPEAVGIQNYVVDIGPFDPDGLNLHILGRDEGDFDVGVWPLFWYARRE